MLTWYYTTDDSTEAEGLESMSLSTFKRRQAPLLPNIYAASGWAKWFARSARLDEVSWSRA
jgi:hypothetical protein